MNKSKITTLGLAAILCAGALTTAMAVAPLPMGWYLEANGGASRTSNTNYAPGSSVSTSGLAWNGNAGYKFMPFFAVEAGYTQYSASTAKINGVKIAKASYYSYDIAGKGILPIGDLGFDLFAKLGIAHLHSKVSAENSTYAAAYGIPVSTGTSNVNGYYYGLGAEYYFLPAFAMNGQWQRAKGNSQTGNQNLYSLGLSYLFG